MTTVTTAARPAVHVVVDSPVDPLVLVSDGSALTGVYLRGHRHVTEDARGDRVDAAAAPAVLRKAATQLGEYFAGERTAFDLPLAPRGTDFQQRVWLGLRDIPYGQTRSYAELARAVGAAGAFRAVGLANGRNPLSIVVPCHRVVGADGSLTGYGGGVERKRVLLDLERSVAGSALW